MENEKTLVPHDREYTPSHYRIFSYWKDKCVTKDGIPADNGGIEVVNDWGEPSCWACGKQVDLSGYKTYDQNLANNDFVKIYGYRAVKVHLQRCHIVPHSLGGSDRDVSNYFLLCHKCHSESPDTENPRNFFRWFYRKRTGCTFGLDFRTLYRMVKAECDNQGKDINTIGSNGFTAIAQHGSEVSEQSMMYSIVDSCEELKAT